MKVDFEKCDAEIRIVADRRRGIFANQSMVKGFRSTRTAGQAPTAMSSHGLLVLALVNGLTGISRQQAVKAKGKPGKLRVNVVSCDATFGDALRALMVSDKEIMKQTPFRAGRNLRMMLARELARVHVTFSTVPSDDQGFMALRRYGRMNVLDPKAFRDFPLLQPTVVNSVV